MTLLLVAMLLGPAAPPTPVVSEVVLDLPEPEAVRFRPYVDIHPGDHLDPQQVRTALATLYGTGEFSDVVAETETVAPGSVRLILHPKPVLRLESVRVTGLREISGRDALRLAHLTQGEPLWHGRLDRACQDLRSALETDGYLQAHVTAETTALAHGSQVLFRIAPGPRARVRAIHVSGAKGQAEALVEQTIRPRPGQWFSRRKLSASLDKARARLWRAGFLRATLVPREAPEPGGAFIDLTIEASPGPSTEIGFRGAEPSAKVQRAVRRSLFASGINPDSVAGAGDLIETDFRKQGYQDVRVTTHDAAGGSQLLFDTHTGPILRVSVVRVAGLPPDATLPALKTRAGRAFDPEDLDADADAVRAALRADGYPDAAVETATLSATAAGSVPITLHVHPGPRRLIGRVTVRKAPSEGDVTIDPGLRTGDPYRLEDLATVRAAALNACRNAGYPFAEVTITTQEPVRGSSVDVDVSIDLGPRAIIDHILVTGLVHTKPEVVRRELLFAEGQPLRWDRVLESHRRLATLGLFRSVRISELNPDDRAHHTLVVALEEAPRSNVTYGLGAAGIGAGTNPVLRASGDVTRRNLGGLDRTLSLFARLSFRGSRVLATYREPYVLGHKIDLSFLAYREDEERTAFSYDRVGIGLQTTRTLSAERSLVFRYAVSRTRLTDLTVPVADVDREFRSSRTAGPSFSLFLDHRDDPLDPRRGQFLSGELQFSHAVLGGASFFKSFVQASEFKPVTPRLLLAVGTRVGLAWPLRGEDLAAPERFFAGGNYSMRGFVTDGVLPEGGQALLTGSVELRIGILGRLSFATFSDIGNVYPTVSDLSLDDLRYTAGVGLRYRTPVGPLRVDWAHKLDRRPGESAYRFHVTVGHAF